MRPPESAGGGGPFGKRKARVIPDPPEMDEAQGRRAFWFVLVLLAVTAPAMAGVVTLNVVADPYGTVGTRFFPTVTASDRTVKADKIEELKEPPELVVLGSSRSMRYEPSYLEEKTGLRTFNAGVNGIGGIADAWAMTQFIHETWPDARPAYLWFIDVESYVPFEIGVRTAGEPRLARFVDQASAGEGARRLATAVWENRSTMCSLATAWESGRLLLFRKKAKVEQTKYRKRILDDGALKQRRWSEREWKRRWVDSRERYTELYATIYERMDPRTEEYFEKTLEFMNEQGAAPLVVLTPINPKLRRILVPLGWNERHEQVTAYIEAQQSVYDLTFLDMTDPTVFGFDPTQWYDGVHMTAINTRPAIDHVLEQTGGVPPVEPAASGD